MGSPPVASMDLWTAFALAAFAYAAVPGPGTVYVAAQAIMREPRSALWGALGLHCGGYVIVFASSAGLTALFSAVPVIYEGLKLLGAGYLVWLGGRMIFAGPGGPDRVDRSFHTDKHHPATFSQAVLVEILNPTTVVFYVAFLPQFIVPAGELPVWLQFLLLGALVNLIFSLCDLFTILLAGKIKAGVTNTGTGQRLVGWAGGSALIGLGLRLATDRS